MTKNDTIKGLPDMEPLHTAVVLSMRARKVNSAGLLSHCRVLLEDRITSQGDITSGGIPLLCDYRPVFDSEIVTRLDQAGAVCLAKVSKEDLPQALLCHSASLGIAGAWEASFFQKDIYACKPSFGRISRYGLMSQVSSMDTIGLYGLDLETIALGLEALAGADPKDLNAACQKAEAYAKRLKAPSGVKRVGFLDMDPALYVPFFEKEGIVFSVFNSKPDFKKAVDACHRILAQAEAYSNHAALDGIRYGRRALVDQMPAMIDQTRKEYLPLDWQIQDQLGARSLDSGLFVQAQKLRRLLVHMVSAYFSEVDILVHALPTIDFLTGYPGLSLPSGLHMCGPAFSEGRLLSFGNELARGGY